MDTYTFFAPERGDESRDPVSEVSGSTQTAEKSQELYCPFIGMGITF
jgi:hypothetical protein